MKFYEKNAALLKANRTRFTNALDKNAIAIFRSNHEVISNGDSLYKYQPNSDLFWLSGITQEESMLILCPDFPVKMYREILVLQKPNLLKEKWDGKRLTPKEATDISGIGCVVWMEQIEPLLNKLIHHSNSIYLNTNENDRRPPYFFTSDYALIEELRRKFPLHQYQRASKILKQLRGIKTKYEIECIKKAISITHHTFMDILKSLQPGMGEYEVEGIIYKNFLAQKANDVAYSSIIASGKNACILHYVENNNECKDGDLVLMDFGAKYSGYCADLTRTVPVNGRFTKRQKEVYNACLSLHNYAKRILKAGITLDSYTAKVGEQATKEFLKIGLLTKADIKNEDAQHRAYSKYLYHGISHHLGVDVHDIGDTLNPIKEHMVFTVEPGIYIEEEHMGIRIENNVVITKSGNIDLMKEIPITVEDIENCMKKK